MDTTTAAQQAGVTTATVRAWCRMGAVRATKIARRWVISTASLARRIALGIRRTRKASTVDLNTSYTYTLPGYGTVTKTPTVRTRTTKSGVTITRVTGIIALLADRIDAITDAGEREITLDRLHGADIAIADQDRPELTKNHSGAHARDNGRISTTYHGTTRIPTDDVLDLAEQIRTHLGL